jgi:hypothetical protein
MKKNMDQPPQRLGLLANGSSRRWDVTLDEELDGDEWSLEIDGPLLYLVFQIHDLLVLREALRFLQAAPCLNGIQNGKCEHLPNEIRLGRFGSASVSLHWDDEDFPRCFIVIGPKARSTLRINLDAEDIRMLGDAFEQVLKDMP